MGIAGAPYLLMLGMNSHGVASVSNSVHSTDNRLGVPNVFVRRATLERAERRRGARARADRAGGRAAPTTCSPTPAARCGTWRPRRRRAPSWTTPPRATPPTPTTTSPRRCGRSKARTTRSRVCGSRPRSACWRKGIEDEEDPVDLVARVLRCHEPGPDQAICGHPDESEPPADQGMTVGSMICDLDERRIHVCAGRALREPLPDLRDVGAAACLDRLSTSSSPTAASSTAAATPGTTATWRCGATASPPIGAPGALSGRRVVDAAGRYVTPGFVDPHTHSDISILQHPRADSVVRQGVTTHVTGNCGMSPAPLSAAHREEALHNWGHYWDISGVSWEWRSFGAVPARAGARAQGDQRGAARRPRRPAARGDGVLRGGGERAASWRAWSGFSTPPCAPEPTACPRGSSIRPAASPGRRSSPRLCATVARYRGIYTSHVRGERETILRGGGRGHRHRPAQRRGRRRDLAQRAQVGRAGRTPAPTLPSSNRRGGRVWTSRPTTTSTRSSRRVCLGPCRSRCSTSTMPN